MGGGGVGGVGVEIGRRVSEVAWCHLKFNYKVISLHKGDFILP